MKFFYSTFAWVFGILFLLTGILILVQSIFAGACFVFASFLIIPPIKRFVEEKIKRNLTAKFRVISVFILFVLVGFFINQSQNEDAIKLAEAQKQEKIDLFIEQKPTIISSIEEYLNRKEYQKAFEKSKEYIFASDADIEKLYHKAKIEIERIEKEKEIESILSELKSIPEKEYEKNKSLYEKLNTLVPDNKSYLDKLEFYKNKTKEEQEKIAIAEARKKKIEQQFSAWDGSHRNLEKIIKKAMNDPDSYEHDETSYWDKGEYLIVLTRYRGRNAFGGMVRGYVKAKVGLNGIVYEILEEN